MCTAIYLKGNGLFGRTLDYDISYGEEVVITPRSFPFKFRGAGTLNRHFAFIGTAKVADGFPLYYDAMNEKGVYIAGLNFVGNAVYSNGGNGKVDIAQFELIPYLMGTCSSVDGVVYELSKINVTGQPFNKEMPTAQLHWLVADKDGCITVECVEGGVKIYKNAVGVLTNNPPFDMQTFNLNDYRNLTAEERQSSFGVGLDDYSRGLGAIGLPGDWSSASRFVRAAFVTANSICGDSEEAAVIHFFRLLNTVAQPAGSCRVGGGLERTIYSSCCSPKTGRYYYNTYSSYGIRAVQMNNKEGTELVRFPHKSVDVVIQE